MPITPTNIPDAIPELDPELPAEQFAASGWMWWLLAALLLIALIGSALYIYLYRRRTQAPESVTTPAQQALDALDALQADCPQLLREFSLQLSMILRRFLQGELQDPALYETHEEFSRRIDSLSAVPEPLRLPMLSLLEQLADLKYAASNAGDAAAMTDFIERARDLLCKIRDTQQAQNTPAAAPLHALLPLAVVSGTRELEWGSPGWLWVLLLLIPLFFLRRREGAEGSICLPTLSFVRPLLSSPHTLAGRLGPICSALAAVALVLALAQPRWRLEHEEQKVSGIDIMIACDLSGSMGLRDMVFSVRDERGRTGRATVDRLQAAKHVISNFIADRPNDRIGMLAFAGRAKLCSPLTLDHAILRYIMEQFYLPEAGQFGQADRPGYVEPDGTAIGTAIAGAATRLHERVDTKSKVIILVTDGVNNSGSISPIDAAKEAAKLDIKVFTIAIGRDERLSRYTADVNTFDEKTLREIATITGGRFYRAGSGAQLQEAFRSIDSLEKTDATRRKLVSFDPLFMYPLTAALILLLLGFSFSELRTRFAP